MSWNRSKNNGVGGLNKKLPFLNVHTQVAKKKGGEVSGHSPIH